VLRSAHLDSQAPKRRRATVPAWTIERSYFASDVEREHSIALLRDAVVGERLTLEQFIDRVS